jgi:hypothetical protein
MEFVGERARMGEHMRTGEQERAGGQLSEGQAAERELMCRRRRAVHAESGREMKKKKLSRKKANKWVRMFLRGQVGRHVFDGQFPVFVPPDHISCLKTFTSSIPNRVFPISCTFYYVFHGFFSGFRLFTVW